MTTEEIDSERFKLRRFITDPMWAALLAAFVVLTLCFAQVPSRLSASSGRWCTSSRDGLMAALVAAIGVGSIGSLCQMIFRRPISVLLRLRKKVETLICDKCYRVKSPDGNKTCGCGGKFEDLDLWKWVDDQAEGGK